MPVVFVYGTLKRGDCRHVHLSGATALGPAVTAAGYRLFHLGDYPGLIEDPSGGAIEGELYEVSTQQLLHLDDVEGTADTCYARRPIQLEPPGSQETPEAYFYLGSVVGKPEILRRWEVPAQVKPRP